MSLIERAATQKDEKRLEGGAAFGGVVEALRESVNERLSAVEAAQLIRRSPKQARSEIERVCVRVLKEEPWLLSGFESEEVVARYLDDVFGLGPLQDLLNDETVTEVMVNGSGSLFFEREGNLHPAERAFSSDDQVYALIDKIISPLGRRVDESSPMVNARLPEGHRVNAVIPPLALDGPVVTIRKFRAHAFSLDEMRSLGSFDRDIQTLMEWAVLRRCNIAVSGGTGSGKTTLLNALSAVIPFSERIVTIEDSAELRFSEHPHVVRLEARPKNAEGVGEVTIKDLVVNSLRMRPDRIVVGECRGSEALDMLQAMNTGHDGSLTTLHANSPIEAVSRLTTMVRYAAELPVEVIEGQIASAIDLVVQTARCPDGKRQVSQVVGYVLNRESRHCEAIPYFERDMVTGDARWRAVPPWIEDLPYLGVAGVEEVEQWKRRVLRSA